MRVRNIIISAAVIGATAIGSAAPAMASGTPSPVTASATVAQTITLTGPTPNTIAFGSSLTPGATATAPAIAYNVVSNDTTGYTVQVTPGAQWLADSGGADVIANSAMSVSTNGGTAQAFSQATAITVASKTGVSGGSGDAYSDVYKLAIPATTPAATYTETLTYLAVGK